MRRVLFVLLIVLSMVSTWYGVQIGEARMIDWFGVALLLGCFAALISIHTWQGASNKLLLLLLLMGMNAVVGLLTAWNPTIAILLLVLGLLIACNISDSVTTITNPTKAHGGKRS